MKNQESGLLTLHSVPHPTKEEGNKEGRRGSKYGPMNFCSLNCYSAILRDEKENKKKNHDFMCVLICMQAQYEVLYNHCPCKSHNFLNGGLLSPFPLRDLRLREVK